MGLLDSLFGGGPKPSGGLDLSQWLQALQQNKGNPIGAVGQYMGGQKKGDWNIQPPIDTSMFGSGTPVGTWLQSLQQNQGNPIAAVGQFMQQKRAPVAPVATAAPGSFAAQGSPLLSMLAGSQALPGSSGGDTYESIKAKYGVGAAKAWEKGRFTG